MYNDLPTFRRPGVEAGAFDRVRISIADPDVIRNQWSHGEVKKPETINHRSFKPERDGLFCAQIFGPIKDYECLCGRYKRMKYRGVVCEKCGVEVTLKKVRRERMGHIELAAPVAHVWFLKSTASSIGLMLGMKVSELKQIIYFERYVVVESGTTQLAKRQILTEEQYEAALQKYGASEFHAGMGAEAVRALLEKMDGQNLVDEAEQLRARFESLKRELRTKRLLARIARVLTLRPRDLEKLITWQGAVVLDPGSVARLAEGQLLTADRLSRVGERYAAKGAIFASGPSGLRDYFALRLARGLETDEGLYEELASVLGPFLEEEVIHLEEDANLHTAEALELAEHEDRLAGALSLEGGAFSSLMEGSNHVVLKRRGPAVALGKMVAEKEVAAADSGDSKKKRTLTRMTAVRFLIDAARRKGFQNGDARAAGDWGTAHAARLIRLGISGSGEMPGEGVNEKELKRILEEVNKRRRFLNKFIDSGNRPEWMVLTVLPVIPPDLRPLVQLDGGRFATSDLNELYRRVINRNNRLKKLNDQQAPEIIVRNEKRMLQRSVDALLANGAVGEPSLDANKRPLKSFSDMLFGKQGRFRQNLLGKRVDFSGRSVIVVGPELKLHQCGLPKRMALELFKPFIFARLAAQGYSPTIKQSKRFVESEAPMVWDALAEVIREHPVLLNRAPTLHRLGIQAFEPVLIEGKAIQLHPLVCAAFNADFDGDQMAVHVPLSLESQLEARVLMMSTNNILSPADGKPVIVPSQDIILGLYYLSLKLEGEPGEGIAFSGPAEAEHAAFAGQITPQSQVKIRIETFDENGEAVVRRYETTLGRVRLAALLPRNPAIPFDIVNRVLRKAEVRQLIDTVYRHCGQKETVIFCDQMMQLGFSEACRAGISVGMADMVIPAEKEQLVRETQDKVEELGRQCSEHLITETDKYNRAVEAWTQCTDAISDAVVREISEPVKNPSTGQMVPNSVYMMMHSGARGSKDQMKQIAGMRGLMSKPSGEIIDTPIIANFMDGLSVREYFYSTHGARKGQTDTALKTARSGYLTRRLVYLAHSCVVREDDCHTDKGIAIDAVVPGERHPVPFASRLLGRVASENVVDKSTGVLLVRTGNMIKEDHAFRIQDAGVPRVRVRSPLTCESGDGVCALCYGRDLARGELVNIGETVGIIAAQSIGEPGTQLTMRTFHSGGAAAVSERTYLEAPVDGHFELRDAKVVVDEQERTVAMGRSAKVVFFDTHEREYALERLPYGTRIAGGNVGTGAVSGTVQAGDRIAEWDPYNHVVLAESDGEVVYEDLIVGLSYREEIDEATGAQRRAVTDWIGTTSAADRPQSGVRLSSLRPSLVLVDDKGEPLQLEPGVEARSLLSVGAMILVENGEKVRAGKVLARIPRHSATSSDITGGLPRLEALFNVHGSKEASKAIIARIDGRIRFGPVRGNNRRLIIDPHDPSEEPVEYSIPKDRHIAVSEGAEIQKGQYLIDGDPAPQDILDVYGEEVGQLRLARYLIDESHKVYRAQGVEINDKHIEVIVRQMLRKVKITDPGETHLLEDERVDRSELAEINRTAISEGRAPAAGQPVVRRYFDEMRRDTSSFIAEASFVETQRVLTRAAAEGEIDHLLGLKENVVVGRLIPAGTGLVSRQVRREATQRDRVIEDERRREREESLRQIEASQRARNAFAESFAEAGPKEPEEQPAA